MCQCTEYFKVINSTNVLFKFCIRPISLKSSYGEYEMLFNGNGSVRGVMRRSRVVLRKEGKHVQYPEDIVSEVRKAGLKYPYQAQHCQVAKT